MVNLLGKVALITGASSGIGAATAIHFASLGCAVAINGRNVTKLSKVSLECVAAGLPKEKVLVVVGDVSVEQEVINIVEKTISHFGKLDILVNNAGIAIMGDMENHNTEMFDKIMNTNLKGPFNLIKQCAPHLKVTKGSIINVSSVSAVRIFPMTHAYSLSKAGLDHITKTTARELGKYEIRVNGVNPGFVATDIFEQLGYPPDQIDKVLEDLKKLHLLSKVADSMEIAKPIAFLASDDASFMTGSNVLIDGGLSIMGNEF